MALVLIVVLTENVALMNYFWHSCRLMLKLICDQTIRAYAAQGFDNAHQYHPCIAYLYSSMYGLKCMTKDFEKSLKHIDGYTLFMSAKQK